MADSLSSNPAAASGAYDPSAVEHKWYERWEKEGLFSPDPDPEKTPYTITIPPPNITGSLHMGHALCYPLQDVYGRYQRLLGKSVQIIPGQDHAGIATQSVVEKKLKKEGLSGAKLGREEFLRRVWDWRQESGDTILRQLRLLGCAFDWNETRFTMDDSYAKAVLTVFIDWFERGLIFRGRRVVNWDPVLKTSVSDIETERKTVKGNLFYVQYPLVGEEGSITIATTRPETMFADVAVAVHPSDPRYQEYIGKRVRLPLTDREIPIIADAYVDAEFGTGALKITPAHDANDYQVGQRHSLPMPSCIDESGKLTELAGEFAGKDRFEARKPVSEALEAGGFLLKTELHEIALTISERSGEPIEPLLSEQWFVDQPELAGPAIEAVESGQIRFVPERYTGIYLDWMRNIREWCVSRQLWWGHRIPIYYTESGKAIAAFGAEEAAQKAAPEKIASQEEDVLDTWFSSALWTFATQGWPEQPPKRHPTDLLITDRNIIFLWVSRMAMAALDQVQQVPFRDVFIYATVLTADGRRMSKSLGTGVDPTEVIEKFGADALRWTLFSQTGVNQDIRYSEDRVKEARNLLNKIWNASKFVQMHVEGPVQQPKELQIEDRWILSRLARTEREVREAYETYDLQSACQSLYRFFWSEFADWYIEISKSRLTQPEEANTVRFVLLECLASFVVMAAPILPFVAEEIYERLPLNDKAEFCMVAKWPSQVQNLADSEAEDSFERMISITRSIRALRAEAGVSPMKPVSKVHLSESLGELDPTLRSQAWVEEIVMGEPQGVRSIGALAEGVQIWLPIEGLIDFEKEREKVEAQIKKLNEALVKSQQKMSNPNFVQRAKPEVVEKERQVMDETSREIELLTARLQQFG
ncbi:MAG: valine--tRNA ligase [Fimbriimonadaceae bacterium]